MSCELLGGRCDAWVVLKNFSSKPVKRVVWKCKIAKAACLPAKMHRLLAILPLLTSFSPPLQRCRRARRAITPKAANGAEDLSKLKVADLKVLLKERGLKVSGKKQELIDRLEEHAAAEAPKPPPAPTPRVTPGNVPDAQLAETIVDLLVTEIVEARRSNTTINPDTLASKREALLAYSCKMQRLCLWLIA